MSKEKVFIVISHKHSVKKGTHTKRGVEAQWEVSETIEFVNQLRNRHITTSSAVGDYLNRKMISGARHGMDTYEKFDAYIRTKYEKQMAELDAAYASQVVDLTPVEIEPEVFKDQFGNERARTVFDPA